MAWLLGAADPAADRADDARYPAPLAGAVVTDTDLGRLCFSSCFSAARLSDGQPKPSPICCACGDSASGLAALPDREGS